VEPLYRIAQSAVIPPLRFWFNWRFEGGEHVPETGPLLVAGNHISYLDWFADGYLLVRRGRRPRFLAKSELWRNRALAWVLGGVGQIPVERGTGSPAPLEAARAELAAGGTIVMFPEGTISKMPGHLPGEAKTGIARLAFWMPAFLSRVRGMPLKEATVTFGINPGQSIDVDLDRVFEE
jgi:1-acyl-sn-glycerol-3-phosphate acyltransferase